MIFVGLKIRVDAPGVLAALRPWREVVKLEREHARKGHEAGPKKQNLYDGRLNIYIQSIG